MATKKTSSAIAQQFSGLPLKALIGAPLKAATDANGMMARTQTQFLLSTCFNESEEDSDILTPIMVKLVLKRATISPDGKPKEELPMYFSVPLMTLIPINSLVVEKLNLSFEMEVKSSTHETAETVKDAKGAINDKLSSNYRGQQFTSELHGSIASKSNSETDSSARYEISMEAGQLPLPKGITTIIDVFTKNIAPIPLKDKE